VSHQLNAASHTKRKHPAKALLTPSAAWKEILCQCRLSNTQAALPCLRRDTSVISRRLGLQSCRAVANSAFLKQSSFRNSHRLVVTYSFHLWRWLSWATLEVLRSPNRDTFQYRQLQGPIWQPEIPPYHNSDVSQIDLQVYSLKYSDSTRAIRLLFVKTSFVHLHKHGRLRPPRNCDVESM